MWAIVFHEYDKELYSWTYEELRRSLVHKKSPSPCGAGFGRRGYSERDPLPPHPVAVPFRTYKKVKHFGAQSLLPERTGQMPIEGAGKEQVDSLFQQ
jgi:hypothetical protein